ncbi:unnamed protein product [Trifolium pratense]|uniref:Uncharacterized protein n=1 Tax=Trifolium pratense TaxID=57577 RepID=A0ACB0KEV3_TRIPR|nr:unnamed protein product [Trifolium pratense]
MCGIVGHKIGECKAEGFKCYKCGRFGHKSEECKNLIVCFNCSKEGHISTVCKKPKKVSGKVFALSGDDAGENDNLIRGTCFILNTPLNAIIDTRATHSFISLNCVKRLNLATTIMSGCMAIETPASDFVITKLVCVNCPVTAFGKDFGMDLVCIPLSNIDVIFGMNWLMHNHVHINCCAKTITFLRLEENMSSNLMKSEEVVRFLNEHAKLFVMFASLKLEGKYEVSELPVVCEFTDVFSDDVSNLPPERKVKFTIDLALGTSPISMAPYRMSA